MVTSALTAEAQTRIMMSGTGTGVAAVAESIFRVFKSNFLFDLEGREKCMSS